MSKNAYTSKSLLYLTVKARLSGVSRSSVWMPSLNVKVTGAPGSVLPLMVVVGVPFGILGARLYHVITDYQLYFGGGENPVTALYVWRGGLGVCRRVLFGAVVLIALRRAGSVVHVSPSDG